MQIGAFQAKTHFSELLEKTKNGQSYVVTHRGIPIAEIKPIQKTKNLESIKTLIHDIKNFRKNKNILNKNETFKDLSHHEHQY